MNFDALAVTAGKMVDGNKGLLAIDESDGTIKKRFDTIGVASTEENRRDYRANLLRADGLGNFIGGAILFDETLRQSAADGSRIVDLLKAQGIRISMDGRGAWRDNILVERLWRSVKYEEVYLYAYESVTAARAGLDRYFQFYNGRRPHSSLAGQTPDQVYLNSPPQPQAA